MARIPSRTTAGEEIMGRSAKSYVKSVAFQAILKSPYFWGVIAIIAVLLGIFFINNGHLSNAMFNIWVLIGLSAGFIYGGLKGKTTFSGILTGLLVAAIVVAFIFFLPMIQTFSEPVISQISGLKEFGQKGIDLAKEGPEKFIESQLPKEFTDPKTEKEAQRTISVSFLSSIAKEPLSITSRVGVTSKEDIFVQAKCLLDGQEITADPSSFNLKGSNTEQYVSVTCLSPKKGKELSLKLTAPFKSESLLGINVGEMDTIGRRESIMQYESPYSLVLDLYDSQPLVVREVPYPLYLKFFRSESKTKVIELKSLNISTISKRLRLNCEEPLDRLKFSANREELDKIVTDKSRDGFTFPCEIEVIEIPDKGTELTIIEAKAEYTIEKEFKTSLSS